MRSGMATSKNFNYSDIRYGAHDKAERYALTAYVLFVFLSSLIGDSVILIASFHKDAFKVNKFIVTVIKHIAVADLTSIFSYGLPNIISLIANSWILGDALCYLGPYVAYMVFPTGMFLITLLTTSKLLIMRYPLRTASWSSKRAHQICAFIWIISLIFPLRYVIVDRDDVAFDYRVYNCEYGYNARIWNEGLKLPMAILGFITYVIPNVIIIATTVPTLKYLVKARTSALRVRGSVPWQGALTVTLTSFVFCIATLPYSFDATAFPFLQQDAVGKFHVHLFKISYFMTMLNLMSNFYIYTLTIRSFRRFILSKLLMVAPTLPQIPGNFVSTIRGEISYINVISTLHLLN